MRVVSHTGRDRAALEAEPADEPDGRRRVRVAVDDCELEYVGRHVGDQPPTVLSGRQAQLVRDQLAVERLNDANHTATRRDVEVLDPLRRRRPAVQRWYVDTLDP